MQRHWSTWQTQNHSCPWSWPLCL